MQSKKLNKETIQLLAVRELSFPAFGIGDVIEVSQWVQEGDKKRIQIFRGNVIARNNNAGSSTFTVRKIAADNIAVERIYPLYSPIIDSIKLIAEGKVRRAKLYYIRDKIGEDAVIEEKVVRKVKRVKGSATTAAAVAPVESVDLAA